LDRRQLEFPTSYWSSVWGLRREERIKYQG
jgi:hypothetical protein